MLAWVLALRSEIGIPHSLGEIGIDDAQAAKVGQMAAVDPSAPSNPVAFDASDYTALFERAVGLYATLVNVNAYHQPGVEAGKIAAGSVIALQRKLLPALAEAGPSGATCEGLAASMGAESDVETLFMLLERLVANPHHRVTRVAGTTPFNATYHRT